MRKINKAWGVYILLLVSFNGLASTYDFDGELTVYNALGEPSVPSPVSGYVDFDLTTGSGSGGVLQEFLPKTGGATFGNIQITTIAGSLFDVDFTVDLLGSNFTGSLVWEMFELVDGSLSVITADGNGDGIPGLPLSEESPFPGFSMALDGLLTPVPAPAAIWLFGSGLIGLVSLAKRKV